ncbi:MAG: ketopantoate reductase family protein [Balneolaceae bacterium]|nr:ketopantoate reductase family protein [Balneolaceae bacterium]
MNFNQVMVMGAGAVGGYFGARIAEHSNAEVSFIARGAHRRAIQERGLQINSPDGDSTVRLKVFDDAAKAPAPDLILFTVKSYDTEEALQAIKSVVGEQTQVLTIQNGIENYSKLKKAFGAGHVIQGFCRIGASITEPGVIEHNSMGSVVVGEQDGTHTERMKALKALFEKAPVRFSVSDDITHQVWVKFSWNCIFNMVTAVAQVTVDKLFEEQESEQLCYDLFEEIKLVAAEEGVPLLERDKEKVIEDSRGLEGFTTSTYNDRQKGKKLEFEAFTGALLRLARIHEVGIPKNQTLYAFLKLVN